MNTATESGNRNYLCFIALAYVRGLVELRTVVSLALRKLTENACRAARSHYGLRGLVHTPGWGRSS